MQHKLVSIAKDYFLDPVAFTRFAVTLHNRYGVHHENGIPNTTTWFVNDLVRDFKALPADQLKKYSSPVLTSVDLMGVNVYGWFPTIDAGCLIWSSYGSKNVLFATPNWENDELTPFTIVHPNTEDGGKTVITLKFYDTCPLDQQFDLYVSVLETILKTL